MKYPQATVEELLEADAALTAEDWDRAHALYEALYARCADNENIHAGLGFAAYKSGNIDAALRHFSAACIRRQEPKWIMFLIDALLTGGSTLAAWRLLDFAENQFPEIHQQLLALGVINRATQSMDQMMPSDGSLGWNVADDAELSPLKEKATLITQALVDGDNRRALELGKELGATHTLNPGLAVNIGLAFKRVGDFGEARKLYIRSFRACPSHGSACANLGNLMIENGEVTQAIRFLQAGVIAEPGQSIVWSNLAAACNQTGVLPVEAEYAARRALQKNDLNETSKANTHRLLAAALSRQGRNSEALDEYEKGYEEDDETSTTATLLSILMSDRHSSDEITAAHLKYGKRLQQRYGDPVTRPPVSVDASRKIRFGFVSADLRDHSVSYFALPLIERLSELGHSLAGYYNFAGEDEVTAQYKSRMDHWHLIRGKPDEEVASFISADEVDVLVDLSGHTSGHRLPVFFQRPAPLQLTWLGHPATTGLSAVDARITDPIADPQGADARYSEQLIRLDDVFCVYRPLVKNPSARQHPDSPVQAPPALKNGYITFGSCNTISKCSDTTIRIWSRVLSSVEHSKLFLESPGLQNASLARFVLARFAAHGITPDRIIMKGRNRDHQYRVYNEIDVALDTTPLNGGTTTFDLLWMGVPMVTLAGEIFSGRMGASLLTNLGRDQWIAQSEEEFVELAANIADSVSTLSADRQMQRELMEASPLMDELNFAAQFSARVTSVLQDFAG